MPINLERILEQCRLCQMKPGTAPLIDKEEFISKVFDCTRIKLNKHDHLFPKTVCPSCKHTIEDFFTFAEEIRLVDQKLRQQISEYEDSESKLLRNTKCPTGLKEKVKIRNDKKRFKCPACPRTYARFKNLQLHKRGHVNLYCAGCEVIFDDLLAHKNHTCSTSNRVSTNDSELQRRISDDTVKDDANNDKVTEKSEPKKEWFEDEFPVKANFNVEVKEPRCKLETTKIKNEDGINSTEDNVNVSDNNHEPLIEAHVNQKNKFKGCEVCSERFTCKADLRAHQKIHGNCFSCTYENCKKICTSAYTLRTHLMRHEGKMPFLCVTCGKGFTTKNSLNCHEKTHAKVKGYACKECNIGFSVASNLRAHQKKHHEGVRFYCSQCTRAFITKCSLERHELVHTGIKEFKCESCRAAFYTNKELLKHQRYHQGLRLYKCDQCFKTFFEKHHLTIHIRVHTGERPYACKITGCGKSFAESQKLSRHIKARHPPV